MFQLGRLFTTAAIVSVTSRCRTRGVPRASGAGCFAERPDVVFAATGRPSCFQDSRGRGAENRGQPVSSPSTSACAQVEGRRCRNRRRHRRSIRRGNRISPPASPIQSRAPSQCRPHSPRYSLAWRPRTTPCSRGSSASRTRLRSAASPRDRTCAMRSASVDLDELHHWARRTCCPGACRRVDFSRPWMWAMFDG